MNERYNHCVEEKKKQTQTHKFEIIINKNIDHSYRDHKCKMYIPSVMTRTNKMGKRKERDREMAK